MPRVSVSSDIGLHYHDLGSGPAVVLIHGGCMSHRIWESQVNALLNDGFRVVTLDLRGHGNSDKPVSPYTAKMYADDLEIVVESLGIDSFTLLGWSLGATIAITFAEKHPDRLDRIVLVSSAIFARIAAVASNETVNPDLPLAKMLDNQRVDRPRGMKKFVAGMFSSEPDEWMLHWIWSIAMQTPMRVALKTLEIYRDPNHEALYETLRRLEIPGVVFHGANDRSATIDDAQTIATEIFDEGTCVAFDHSAHVPFLEESTRFNDELRTVMK